MIKMKEIFHIKRRTSKKNSRDLFEIFGDLDELDDGKSMIDNDEETTENKR